MSLLEVDQLVLFHSENKRTFIYRQALGDSAGPGVGWVAPDGVTQPILD
jgi:hypothetical protein